MSQFDSIIFDLDGTLWDGSTGRLFDGVPEGIKRLAKDFKIYLVSACEEDYLDEFFKRSGLGALFLDSLCYGHTQASKAENIREIVKRNGLRRAVYVGDTANDQASAFFAGVKFIFARYGFGRVDISCPAVDSFAELVTTLTSQRPRPTISVRKLTPGEYQEASAFYRSVGYSPATQPSDKFFAAFDEGKTVGLVRLAYEHDTWVLRGMQILPSYQSSGLGTKLIRILESDLGSSECFCIPHGWLAPFYGQIGFVPVRGAAGVPSFLVERLNENKKKYPHLILMKRPAR